MTLLTRFIFIKTPKAFQCCFNMVDVWIYIPLYRSHDFFFANLKEVNGRIKTCAKSILLVIFLQKDTKFYVTNGPYWKVMYPKPSVVLPQYSRTHIKIKRYHLNVKH